MCHTCKVCPLHVGIECRVTYVSVIRFWQSRHQKKAENVTYLMVYKLLLWLLRFRPKMVTLKNVNVMFFTLTASHVYRYEQTACHLNLSEILFPAI